MVGRELLEGVDLKTISSTKAYDLFKEAAAEGDIELAEVLMELERAILGEDFEKRLTVETSLLPLLMARGVTAVQS